MSDLVGRSPLVRIRPWDKDDLPVIQDISWNTWRETYGSFIPEEDMRAYHDEYYSLDALENKFRTSTVRGYLGLCDEQPAGYMMMSLDRNAARCYVTSLYVLPAYQGHGMGSRMMKEAEKVAREERFDALWLGVMLQNLTATAWYHARGFIFIEHAPFTMGKTTVIHSIGCKKIHAAGGSGVEQ